MPLPNTRRIMLRKARFALPLAALMVALACGHAPKPLHEELRLRGAEAWVAPDLQVACAQLTGDALRDAARLELIEGREGAPQMVGEGWLLQLRRPLHAPDGLHTSLQCLLVHMGTGARAGKVTLLQRADSVQVLSRAGDGPRVQLLVEARELHKDGGDLRRLVQVDVQGVSRVLAEDRADLMHISQGWLMRASEEAPGFVESTGSWHLETRQAILQEGDAWRLGKAAALESPYAALVDFLQAARHGMWRRAKARCDLRRMLALPDGTHGLDLKGSLRLGFPDLLDGELPLQAPPRGPIHYLRDAQGRLGWRVELEKRSSPQGGEHWVLTRLERVISGE